MSKNKTIQKNKLLLVEGADAFHFFLAALRIYKLQENIQILDFGGIDDLSSFLTLLKAMDGFENVETICIARDAETNYQSAIKSIQSILITNFKKSPNKPFEYITEPIKLAFMLFPGFDSSKNLKNGTLEELCLETIDNERKDKAINFVLELHNEEKFKYLHKTKLHSYLSITDKYVGSKIGEASNYGAWNWNHESLIPYKEILEKM